MRHNDNENEHKSVKNNRTNVLTSLCICKCNENVFSCIRHSNELDVGVYIYWYWYQQPKQLDLHIVPGTLRE